MPLFVIAIIAFVIVSMQWEQTRSIDLIDRWARTNNLRILHKEARSFFRGPMFWRASKNQTVYYVTVVTQSGRQRAAWVRCGGRWRGLHSDQIDVRWD